jgi:glyoxylase-like metal-dependent hydrolase (beta-lactamase superfamily II)
MELLLLAMRLHILDLVFGQDGQKNTIHPVILEDSPETLLVDCGYPGFLPRIENAAERQGVLLHQLSGVIITHHDLDHVGGLFELKEKYPHVKVYCSHLERDFVEGKRKAPRLLQAEHLFDSLPDEQKPGALQFQEMLKAIKPVIVDHVFPDDGIAMAGVHIIDTPGHTPGHISLYLPASQTLIAADALVYENGDLDIANPQYTLDLEQAVKSVRKLNQFEISRIICYHGGIVDSGIKEKLDSLPGKYVSL